MSRRARTLVFLVGAAGLAALLALVFLDMPVFGGSVHRYRDLAVAVAARQATANVVASVNFDQRAIDTLGEETILLGSVIGVAALLRPTRREREQRPPRTGRTLETTRLAGYVLLPVTLIIGFDVVAHGQVTPGGGFQGGVVLATGLHLLYLTGNYRALVRLRPVRIFDAGEALGASLFVALGLAGLAVSGAFLRNIFPTGTFGQLLSAGTVPVFNLAVGVEVACGMVVLLSHFFEEDITVTAGARSAKDGE
ncbi:MnhB domain-containing protein [Streptomyces sp. NPDC051322]|uniref:MnhB domain-containing protein n=1 Tax=Streptomyces sp. NPDC051322 TaxID=3154645 RepID=UPI00344E8B6A